MRLLAPLILTVSVLLTSTTASALSCMRPSVQGSFHTYNDAAELYGVFVGTWRPVQPVPAVSSYREQGGPLPTVRYQFTGQGFGTNGPQGPTSTFAVDVRPACAGPWCAGYPKANDRVMVFIEEAYRNGSRRRFEPKPCGGESFSATQANMRAMANCLKGHRCDRPFPGTKPDPEPEPDLCGATGELSDYIGERVERLIGETLPRRTRITRPGDITTKDYRPNRLNILLNARGIIQSMNCG